MIHLHGKLLSKLPETNGGCWGWGRNGKMLVKGYKLPVTR